LMAPLIAEVARVNLRVLKWICTLQCDLPKVSVGGWMVFQQQAPHRRKKAAAMTGGRSGHPAKRIQVQAIYGEGCTRSTFGITLGSKIGVWAAVKPMFLDPIPTKIIGGVRKEEHGFCQAERLAGAQ
jgi:hypothetical protein